MEEKNIDLQMEGISTQGLIELAENMIYNTLDYSEIMQNIALFVDAKNLYYNLKYIQSDEEKEGNLEAKGNEVAMEFIEATYHSMVFYHRQIIELEIFYIHEQAKYMENARKALEFAVKNANTTDKLEQCAKVIELQFNDSDWATEIRKKAYGANWSPSNTEDLSTMNAASNYDLMNLIKKNEGELSNYFKDKQPVGYGKYEDEDKFNLMVL
ncbi:MAG: hypothetical protein PHX13_07760 [Thiovulaceae bacterium]|nr:hypothetical protein [Sulfurimonadaceae bacterium]